MSPSLVDPPSVDPETCAEGKQACEATCVNCTGADAQACLDACNCNFEICTKQRRAPCPLGPDCMNGPTGGGGGPGGGGGAGGAGF
ncbi:MAG: hypothetical protein AAF939_06375 [Planctomycetota bacterium]